MTLAIAPPAQIIGVLVTSTGDAWILRLSCASPAPLLRLSCASCGSVYVQMRDTGEHRCATPDCGGPPAPWPFDRKEAR